MEIFNLEEKEELKNLIKEGYITCRKHKEFNYFIYNYSASCQYSGKWNNITKQCRGLILDEHYNIIARSMEKFFNYGEYGKESNLGELPPYKFFEVYDKLDGSLGILYTTPDGDIAISTRGSFESEQALKANEILSKKFPKLQINPDLTYLVEIIYPNNRIVIDYGDTTDLVLLTIIENATGKDIKRSLVESFARTWKFTLVEKHDYGKDLEFVNQLMNKDKTNREGYVIQFDTGLRVKMKYEEYIRLHKIITGVNTKGIWEMLRDGESLDTLIEKVPDEFHKWTMETSGNFIKAYNKIEKKAKRVITKINKDKAEAPRKEIAKVFLRKTNKEISGVLFAMYDNKEYDKIIWKLIKPKQAIAFKEEI